MSARPRTRTHAVLTGTMLLSIAAVLVAGPASAHVTVGADDDHQGAADSVLTFRVPNEEDSATTVKVDVKFPVKDPLASVKAAPKPGWTLSMKAVTFAQPIVTDDGTLTTGVGEVTWTAASAAQGIPAGGFDSFSVLVGPLPEKAESLAFPTVQTYSDGKSVAWIEPTPAGGTEPEHPAPILKLSAAAAGDGASDAPAASASASAAAGSQASTGPTVEASPAAADGGSAASSAGSGVSATSDFATKSDASTSRTLGILGLVLGALGLLAGGAAFARSSRSSGARTP